MIDDDSPETTGPAVRKFLSANAKKPKYAIGDKVRVINITEDNIAPTAYLGEDGVVVQCEYDMLVEGFMYLVEFDVKRTGRFYLACQGGKMEVHHTSNRWAFSEGELLHADAMIDGDIG